MQSLYKDLYFENCLSLIGVNHKNNYVFIQSEPSLSLTAYKGDELYPLYHFGETDAIHYLPLTNDILSVWLNQSQLNVDIISLDGDLKNSIQLHFPLEVSNPSISNLITDSGDAAVYILIEDEQNHFYWLHVNLEKKVCCRIDLPFKDIEYVNSKHNCILVREDLFPEKSKFFIYILKENRKVELQGSYICSNSTFLCFECEEKQGSKIKIYRTDSLDICKTYIFEHSVLDMRINEQNKLFFVLNYNGVQRLKAGCLDLKDQSTYYINGLEGRIDISNVQNNNICLYKTSLLEGSSWSIVGLDQPYVYEKAGKVPQALNLGEKKFVDDHLVYVPANEIRGAVISFHGGPESCEFDEIRYWGLYRDLLSQGLAVIVFNYSGSAHFGYKYRSLPWKNWHETFSIEIKNIIKSIKSEFKVSEEAITVFGVSFGGGLALAAPVIVPGINAVIAVAPLISLKKHVDNLRVNYPDMVMWFERRFLNDSNKIFFSENYYLRNTNVPVTIIQGKSDEIFNYQYTVDLTEKALNTGKPWSLILETDMPHYPEEMELSKIRYHHIYNSFSKYCNF